MTEAQESYAAGQLDAMPAGAIVTFGHTMEWTKSHADTWASNHDGVSTSAGVVAASSGRLVQWPNGTSVPNGPAPVGIAVPAWATVVDEWTWIHDDESFWQRHVSCAFRGDGDGADVDAFQEVDAVGVVTVRNLVFMVDDTDEMSDPADVLEFGQQIVRAARMMATIDGVPTQRTAR